MAVITTVDSSSTIIPSQSTNENFTLLNILQDSNYRSSSDSNRTIHGNQDSPPHHPGRFNIRSHASKLSRCCGCSVFSALCAATVFLIGIGLSIGFFFWFRSIEIYKFNTFMENQCEDRSFQLQKDLQRNLATLKDLSALVELYYPNINQTQFSQFGTSSSWNSSEIRHILVCPRVDGPKREDWERDNNQTILARRVEDTVRPIPAPQNDVYFPVAMKMDHENPKPWMGYDMNSLEAGRKALQTAQEVKAPAASDPTPLVNNKIGIIVYYPLNIPLLYSVPNTTDRLSGVLTASYDVEQIFTNTLSRGVSCNNVKIFVYDQTQPTGQPFFVYAPPDSDSLYDFTSSKTITMVNRKLEIVCRPIINSVNKHRRQTVLPTIILVLTLIITLLFTIISFCFGKKYESTRKKGEVSQKELVESRRIVDSLARYSDAIVKFLPDPLLFIGPQKIKGANAHFLKKTGYPLDGVLGRDITEIIASFSHSQHIDGNSFKTDVQCADGTSFAAEISISEGFTDSSIEIPRYVMLIRDLTESKRVLQDLSAAKCEAQKANLAKTEILYFLCHEIRNPVHVILGLCSADDNLSDSNEARREMFIAAKFLGSLVDDILSLLNVKVGLLPVRKSEKNLNSSIFALWEEVESLAKGKQLNFKLVLPPEGINVDVLADEYRLHHGLIKVIEHSIRVTPSNGTVTLSVESLNSSTESQNDKSLSTHCQYRFILKDTSNGYSPSDIQKVFNPFDLDKSVSQGTEFDSFGLGLALAQKFLASIGAELRFSSVEGKGNLVTIDIAFERLPTAGSSTSIRTTRRTSQLSPGKGNLKMVPTINENQVKHEPDSSPSFKKTPTVLLVEDNAIVQKVTAKLLRKASCHVITANNGEEAIDIISKESSIDVVLMDLIMPILSGHDATVKLRSQNCQLPIIAVTANALDTEFERCKQEGFDDFVTKPATGETLSSIIQTWIGFTHDCSSSSHENM